MPVSSLVLAHAVQDPTWRTWTFEPGVVLSLALLAGAYAWGVANLWRSAGVGAGIRTRKVAAFALGWLALVAALVSPLDALSESLFSVHMLQHELLMVIAAPLIVLGAPGIAFLWLLPRSIRKAPADVSRRRRLVALWSAITAPAVVWLLHAVALWVWHLPELYDAALEDDMIHALQHVSFFGSAMLFWWGIAHGRYGRLGYGAAVLYVFTTAIHSGVLGALLTFSTTLWYPAYAATSGLTAFGTTPLEDQQLAGLIMWIPASLVFIVVGLAFFAEWLRESARRTRVLPFTAEESQRKRTKALATPLWLLLLTLVLHSAACTNDSYRTAAALTGGDPARGRVALVRYGCDTCHTIPGIRTARALVGPPLTSVASRVYLAGHLPNTVTNMEQWIQHPRQNEPHTAMPDTGVTDGDARDIAAYLYTLR